MEGLYVMSDKELNRFEIIDRLSRRELSQKKASEYLDLGVRQIQRLIKSYKLDGSRGLISKQRGRVSNNKLSDEIKIKIINLIRDNYHDFGPTLAVEKLYEKHDIKVSVGTARSLMIEAGIWITRSNKLKRSYQPRYRRSRVGELIQIDGSNHRWFEERGPKSTLLVYVDDATSKLMNLYFAPSESTFTYCISAKEYIKNHGKPISFYSDRHSIFKVNQKTKKDVIMTQFSRALHELNIDLICANTCQAKGRVERANKTLQDRLVKELRLRDISTMESANKYLPEFIEEYNNRFAKPPLSEEDMHRPLRKEDDLDNIFCFKEDRTVSNSLTIQYDRVTYLLEDIEPNRRLRRKPIVVYEYPDGSISLFSKGRRISSRKIYDKVAPIIQGEVVPNNRLDYVMEFMKKNQELKEIKRSKRCPRKTHLRAD